MNAWTGSGSASVRAGQKQSQQPGFEIGDKWNLEVGGNTETLVRNLLKHFHPPPCLENKIQEWQVGDLSFYCLSTSTSRADLPGPPGSLPAGSVSLPRTFWPGFPIEAELGYLQPLLAVSHPPSVGRLNRGHTGLQMDIPPLDSEPKHLLLAQPAKA